MDKGRRGKDQVHMEELRVERGYASVALMAWHKP